MCGAALALLLGGCAAAQPSAPQALRVAPYGAWYSVATAAADPEQREHLLARDFAALAKMDLNTVFVRDCAPADWPQVLSIAQRHKLATVLADPVALRHVRAGTSVGFANLEATPRGAEPARFVGDVVDDVAYARACALAEAARRAVPPIATCIAVRGNVVIPQAAPFDLVLYANGDAPTEAPAAAPGAIQTVICRQHRRDEQATVHQWLASFHRGLLEGHTGGVVFDVYRALPGNWNGIVQREQPPAPERMAMIRRIVARGRTWQTLLTGLNVQRVAPLQPPPAHAHMALFSGGRRRFLLFVNTSPTHYLRTRLTFGLPLGGQPIERAVTVPTAEDTMPGPVLEARHDELAIPLELPPGEARLYELF